MKRALSASSNTDGGSAAEDFTVQISRERRNPYWDNFLAQCPAGHHEQTSLWGEVKEIYGWQPLRIVVSKGEKIIGGAQVLTRSVGRWGKIGYVSRGPLAASNDPNLIEFILRQLDRVAAMEKLAYVAVVPSYNGHIFEPGLNRLGFRKKPNSLPPGGVMTATLLLDLSADMNSLMAGMRMTTRRHVRRAAREGVTVREGTAPDVETFRRLMWQLCERRGISPTPPQKDFFEHLWGIFQPLGLVKLFIAEIEGAVISAAFTFPFGDTVRIWKIGWAGDRPKSYPNEMLYWELIRWSKRNGYRFFDFVQIEHSLAHNLLHGDAVDWTAAHGPSVFKLGFGGNPVLLCEPYYRFYHPLLRIFSLVGGNGLIGSPTAARLLARFGAHE